MSTRKMLEEEIQSEIELIGKLEVGSDSHKAATEALSKLLDKLNDMDKIEFEYQDRYETREEQSRLKKKELEQDRKDQRIKNTLTGVSVGGGLLVTVWGICKSLKFEEKGVYSSLISRGMINKILPKK